MGPKSLTYAAAVCLCIARLSMCGTVSVVAGVTQYEATPVSTNPNGVPMIYNCAKRQITGRTDVGSGIELRILPLGDSITYGWLSSDGNGYRIGLQEDLSGSNLHFTGSVSAGSMIDNKNEGHVGATISQIAVFAQISLPERPNVVLLHAGINDLNDDSPTDPYATAPDRLGALIDEITAACPDAAIFVAQIVNAANPATEARIQTFNDQIPGLVAQRANAGDHVMLVDMRSVTAADLIDGLHPSDKGYKKIADLWFAGIESADAKGWIKPPVSPDQPTAVTKQQRSSATHLTGLIGPTLLAATGSTLLILTLQIPLIHLQDLEILFL